jgi:CHAP domain
VGPAVRVGCERQAFSLLSFLMKDRTLPAAFLASFLSIARGQLGVIESSENSGDRIRQFQSVTWLDPGPWPWCAAFVCWCLSKASPCPPGLPLPNTPRAFGLEAWGRENGFFVSSPASPTHAGDLVIFSFSHVGIVESTGPRHVSSIEGNTPSPTGHLDGVFRRRRSFSLIRSIVHLS